MLCSRFLDFDSFGTRCSAKTLEVNPMCLEWFVRMLINLKQDIKRFKFLLYYRKSIILANNKRLVSLL